MRWRGDGNVHCVITGAADGIGRSLAHVFGREGYAVTGLDVDEERARKTIAELENAGIEAGFLVRDLTSETDVDSAVTELAEGDEIDVLIHNAGTNAVGRLPLTELDAQLKVVELNLTAPMVLTARLLEAGCIRRDGCIVFLSSLSHFVGYPGAAVYAATKDGIASYARSLRVELRSKGIHVMTVFPGPTRTAHARRYSPDNSREDARMHPDDLARRILVGVKRKDRSLIPGGQNRVAGFVGRWLPALTERAMVRSILEPLDRRVP